MAIDGLGRVGAAPARAAVGTAAAGNTPNGEASPRAAGHSWLQLPTGLPSVPSPVGDWKLPSLPNASDVSRLGADLLEKLDPRSPAPTPYAEERPATMTRAATAGASGQVRPGDDRWGDRPVEATVDLSQQSEWTVSPHIFGRFFESNGRKAYPGLYDQHTANTSFEDWFADPPGPTTNGLPYPDVDRDRGVAMGWERSGDARMVRFSRPGDGPHGEKFQRIANHGNGTAGVSQQLPLPDARTQSFDVHFKARSTVQGPLQVKLLDSQGNVVARQQVDPAKQWGDHSVRLDLADTGTSRFNGQAPMGEYRLVLESQGRGTTDLDMVRVIGSDAVDGKFNPETIERFRDASIPSMRWPGGNVVSHMDWRDGTGPVDERPVEPIYAWGGLEPNYMGIDEYMRWTELTGTEPMVNIGFNPKGEGPSKPITPQDAADLVEYLNGDVTTPMGRLRAQNGHPEPYNVTKFQVGNEVFGAYQYGDASAEEYAKGFNRYYDAMKAKDPDITIIASGIGPRLHGYGGNDWNETLVEHSGHRAEHIDIHLYNKGITNDHDRSRFTEMEYHVATMAYPADLERALVEARDSGEAHGIDDVKLNVGEWNSNPMVSDGWRQVNRDSSAYVVYQTGMYNAFLRQGDSVRHAYQLDHTVFAGDNEGDVSAVSPGLHATRLYAEPFADGTRYHVAPVSVNGPTFDLPKVGERSEPMANVPYIDSSAIVSEDGSKAYVFLTNRNLAKEYPLQFSPPNVRPGDQVTAVIESSPDPLAGQASYGGPNGFTIEERTLTVGADGTIQLDMPPGAFVRLELQP